MFRVIDNYKKLFLLSIKSNFSEILDQVKNDNTNGILIDDLINNTQEE
jgi:hypothetical protein